MCDFTDLYNLRIDSVRRPTFGRFMTLVGATPCGEWPARCALCGGRLRRHGQKRTTYRDLPYRGGSVAIVVDRLRFRCLSCGKTSLQPVAHVCERYRMTDRMVESIGLEATRRPFTAVAAAAGIHEKTVRRIVRERIPQLTTGHSNAAGRR